MTYYSQSFKIKLVLDFNLQDQGPKTPNSPNGIIMFFYSVIRSVGLSLHVQDRVALELEYVLIHIFQHPFSNNLNLWGVGTIIELTISSYIHR